MAELKPSVCVATKNPPKIPMLSATPTKTGPAKIPANTRGTTRYFSGSVDSVISASICSVTFIVAISAAIELVTRAAIIRPTKTGPSSRTMPIATICGTTSGALNLDPPE